MRLYWIVLLMFFISCSGCENKPEITAPPLNAVKEQAENDIEPPADDIEPEKLFSCFLCLQRQGFPYKSLCPIGFYAEWKVH